MPDYSEGFARWVARMSREMSEPENVDLDTLPETDASLRAAYNARYGEGQYHDDMGAVLFCSFCSGPYTYDGDISEEQCCPERVAQERRQR